MINFLLLKSKILTQNHITFKRVSMWKKMKMKIYVKDQSDSERESMTSMKWKIKMTLNKEKLRR